MCLIQVQETKLLGVFLDERLSWSKHINKTVAKMGTGISVVKRYIKLLTNCSQKLVIQALILSNIDYCPVVWSNATRDKIKNIRTNVAAKHEALGWWLKTDFFITFWYFSETFWLQKLHLYYKTTYP